MRGAWTARRLGAVVVLSLALAAGPALAGDMPQWPNEQQAMLRQVEDEVLKVQRQLFAARQRNDPAAVAELSKQFRELQDKRRELIGLTRNQLPSE